MNLAFSQSYWDSIIIPIDELIFFRGVAQPPTSYMSYHIITIISSNLPSNRRHGAARLGAGAGALAPGLHCGAAAAAADARPPASKSTKVPGKRAVSPGKSAGSGGKCCFFWGTCCFFMGKMGKMCFFFNGENGDFGREDG